jgi:methylthioribose-1-phosphate isomerase
LSVSQLYGCDQSNTGGGGNHTVPAAPAGTKAHNFAFDITPAEPVSAIVTEKD